MASIFQKPLDIYKVSKEKRVISGEILASELKRTVNKANNMNNLLKVKLEFSILQQGVCLCCGHIVGSISLECQRDLEYFDYKIDHKFKVVITENSAKLEILEEQYETFLFDGLAIAPIDLVEEEILLLLPIAPKKPLKDCKVDKTSAYYDAFSKQPVDDLEKENPFSVLSTLKKSK